MDFLIVVLLIWTLVWKALALWKAARKNHMVLYVIMFVISTAGILEILYIFVFSEMKKRRAASKEIPAKTARRKARRKRR